MLVIIFLSVFVVFAGFNYLLGSAEPAGTGSSSASSSNAASEIALEGATITGGPLGTSGYDQMVWAPVNTIIDMRIWSEGIDWDEYEGNDGIVIHFLFYDSLGRIVLFEKNIPAYIEIRSPDTNIYYRDISTTRIFKGQTTINSAEEGLPYPMRGIRIPYSEMTFYSDTRGIGTIEVQVNLPDGRVLKDRDRYLYTIP